jgi:hypothetical protein
LFFKQLLLDKNNPFLKKETNQAKTDFRIENLKEQTNQLYIAMLNNDVEKVKKFIYFPRVLIDDNSPDEIDQYKERNAKEFTEIVQGLKEILSESGADVKAEAGNPTELINTDYKQIYSVVPVDIIGKTDQENCVIRVFRLGISQDNGDT